MLIQVQVQDHSIYFKINFRSRNLLFFSKHLQILLVSVQSKAVSTHKLNNTNI